MIEKMKFLSITGPKSDIDRVVNQYLSKYEIHLENAMAQLSQIQHLSPYIQINPYKDLLSRVNEFAGLLKNPKDVPVGDISLEEIQALVDSLGSRISKINGTCEKLAEERASLTEDLKWMTPFLTLPEDIDKLIHYRFVQVRFGRIPVEYYGKFKEYVYDNLDTMFFPCHQDDYVWGLYFVLWTKMEQVDAVFSSMHFERIYLKKDHYFGTPEKIHAELEARLENVNREYTRCQEEMQALLEGDAKSILSAQAALNALSTNFDVRKVAACVKEHQETFYILCGWMSERDCKSFMAEIEHDPNLFCVVEDDQNQVRCKPPTKLKNPKIFKPFEMYIKMYGLPDYHEIDPTIFVALTYSFIFGIMFGDVGQGLLLAVGGFLLYKYKHIELAGIISCAGVFSTFFGFMFGSIFGFEDVLPALWLHPMSNMMTVPFIGKLNTVFIVAIGFGMGIILLCMIFNIINSFRAKDTEKSWFDTNAVAGLVFYGSAVVCIALFVTGHSLPGGIVLFVMFGIPLLMIFFKEPLTALVEKRAEVMPKEKGMFVVQGIFEMFEVLLSYFSNTLSFVRIGAFAVSHAAMMEVVLMLAGAESGNLNWLIVILGNLFVCGMEGLIVGIQVLRLEYYEIFSRFYKGTGRKFEPFRFR